MFVTHSVLRLSSRLVVALSLSLYHDCPLTDRLFSLTMTVVCDADVSVMRECIAPGPSPGLYVIATLIASADFPPFVTTAADDTFISLLPPLSSPVLLFTWLCNSCVRVLSRQLSRHNQN